MHLARTLPGLVRRGWRITIFTLTGEGPLAAPLRAAGIEIVSLPWAARILAKQTMPRRLLRLAGVSLHLVAAMRRLRPAVTHFFLPEAYIVGAICARLAGLGTLAMSRRSLNLYQRKRPGVRQIERVLHRRMAVVIGNSGAVVRELAEEGVPPDRLVLIRNGLEVPSGTSLETRRSIRLQFAIAEDALVLAIVANLIPYKGHRDLIEALGRAAPSLPNWRLLCIGRDDGEGPALREAATRLGIADNILWFGARGDVPALLAAADIGLLVSHEEGFSNALIEAMAAGLPVIATSVGGNIDAVVEGETGFLVPPRAPERLAEALVPLANNPTRRRAMGAAGRQRALSHFSLERCIGDYDRLYRALASGARPGVAADFTLLP
jgi:glycosyltransferase involved in cell wall biosynthesis